MCGSVTVEVTCDLLYASNALYDPLEVLRGAMEMEVAVGPYWVTGVALYCVWWRIQRINIHFQCKMLFLLALCTFTFYISKSSENTKEYALVSTRCNFCL
jgi:hypothetical protein